MGGDNHSHNRRFEHGVHREKNYQGKWSKNETSLHINHQELEAVNKSIVYFLPHLKKNRKTESSCSMRRYHGGTIHQQNGGGGGQNTSHLFKGLESVEYSNSKQHNIESCSSSSSLI